MSPKLIQVAKLYTPHIFDLFHNELDTSLCCQVKRCHALGREVTYVIGLYGEDREYIVKCNVEVNESGGDNICQEIHCTCQKFESFGILCGHAIKALDRINIMEIPERYILGRWRLHAKDYAIEETITVVENDPKLVMATCYRDLCPRMVKLAARSSEYKPAYQLVDKTLKDFSGASSSEDNIEVGTKEFVADPNFSRAKGLKKKEGGHKGGSRLKPWHEKTTKRTKVVSQPTRLTQSIGQSSDIRNIQNSSSNHTPDVEVPYWPQLMNSRYNLLMHDVNFACPPTYPLSTPLSSQASYNPQSSQGLGFDLVEHSPMVAELVFRNDSLFDFFSHLEPPPQN
ncbi:hypothetical protein ACSBR2_004222 [Camellia fascicularis]